MIYFIVSIVSLVDLTFMLVDSRPVAPLLRILLEVRFATGWN